MRVSTYDNIVPYETAETSLDSRGTTTLQRVILAGVLATNTFSHAPVIASSVPVTVGGTCVQTETNFLSTHEKSAWECLQCCQYMANSATDIISYLLSYPEAHSFLAGVIPLLNEVYEHQSKDLSLNLTIDPDTDAPLLELVFKSNLPVDDEFIEKDRLLFDKIQATGIVDGLNFIVFTNC